MKPLTYDIKFVSVELLSKSLTDISGPKVIESMEFYFNFLVDIKLGPPQKVAAVLTNIAIQNKEDSKELARFSTLCVFELKDFENIFKETSDGRFETPVDLEIILKSAGISTTRGIMVSELRGTYLHNAILPVIDMATLINEQRDKQLQPET